MWREVLAVRSGRPTARVIAFNSSTGQDAANPSGTGAAERKSDVQVVTRAVYRANGNPGYIDNDHHSHIFTISLSGADTAPALPRPNKSPTASSTRAASSGRQTARRLYFVSTRVAEPYYDESDAELFAVPAAGGSMTKITSIDGGISSLAVSPDGKQIAFVGTLRGKPIRSYSQPDLWVARDHAGQHAEEPDRRRTTTTSAAVSAAIRRAARRRPQADRLDRRDQESLIVVSAEKGSANLKRVTVADRQDRTGHRRSAERRNVQRDAGRGNHRRGPVDADQHR